MALFDIFRKKEKELYAKKKERKGVIVAGDKKEEAKAVKEGAANRSPAGSSAVASRVLVAPHITEKAVKSKSENVYVFKVRPRANKLLIKKAIEELYGVKVSEVKAARMPEKARFILAHKGRKTGYKKANVILKKGEVIQNI